MAFDRNDPAQVAELKSEVETDPLGIGYNPDNGDTGELLDLINAKNYTTNKPKISAALIRSTTTYDAFDGLLNPEQAWLQWMTGTNGFDEENVVVTADLRQKLAGDPISNDAIWAAADRTEMNAAMLALVNVPGSRAEVLWGYDTVISSQDWFAARDS